MTIVGCINAVGLFLMHTTSTLHGKRRVSRNQIRLIPSCLKPGCQSSSFSVQFKLIFAPVAGLSQGTFSQRAWCSAALFATTYNPQVTAAGLGFLVLSSPMSVVLSFDEVSRYSSPWTFFSVVSFLHP